MAKLTSPRINVTFTELGISAITRGDKGTVAIIVRDAARQAPVTLASATQIPTALGKDNQDYIRRAFLGYTNSPKKVILYTAPLNSAAVPAEEELPAETVQEAAGDEAAVTEEVAAADGETDVAGGDAQSADSDRDLAAALTYMETQEFDYIVGPLHCTAGEAEAIALWVKSQRANRSVKYKAVLPNYAADHSAVVNFATERLMAGAVVYTTAEYCSRIAGLLAGTPMKIAATYAPLPELTGVSHLSKADQDKAVGEGKLIAIWDGRKVKLNRAVTSLVTTSEGMLDSFKKIKIVEIMDLIRTDIHATAEDEYVGKYANTYENKLLLVTAIRGYFMGLEADKLVQPGYTVDIDVDAQERYLVAKGTDTGEMSVQQIKEADTGAYVFLRIRCKILDAIEDIDIIINI